MNLKKPISATMTAMLAVSMATVPAFAAGLMDRCGVCDEAFMEVSGSEKQTYQDYFSVDTVPGLSNESGSAYFEHDTLNLVSYNGNPICYSCLEEKINEYKAANPTLEQSGSTDITASVSSSYTIVVPQTVAMTGDAGTGEKTATVSVTVKGDIPEDQTVTVSATAPVMKREGSTDVTANVSTPKTTWNRSELLNNGTSSDYVVKATLSPGDWSGVLSFNCSLAS